jgi:predicted RNA methylase
MVCCTGYCAAAAQFDSKVAERDLRRYRRRGADATTRLIVAELRRWPLEGRHLLDVGGGIGAISCELADTRLASATMVEASPACLEVARLEVGLKFGSRPIQFIRAHMCLDGGVRQPVTVILQNGSLGSSGEKPLTIPPRASSPAVVRLGAAVS